MKEDNWPSLPCDRRPTGATHDVPKSDLFFSTTDARGVITSSNIVFVALSRFSFQQLLGAPHNIIRHPSMPGGAFKLMWDALNEHQPFCAYVNNLAADGSTYSVFATITPLGDDAYLSVRCRPQCTEIRQQVNALYHSTLDVEEAARNIGQTPRQASATGAEHLSGLIASAGFADVEDFMNAVLPAEMAIRLAHPTNLSALDPGLPDSALLARSMDLSASLQQWLRHQAVLEDVVAHLVATVPLLRQSLADALESGRQLQQPSTSGFDPFMVWIDLWAVMMDGLDTVLLDLESALRELRLSCQRAGFRVSLAALHTEAVAQFAQESTGIGDARGYSSQDRIAALHLLRQALAEGIAITRQHVEQNIALANKTLSAVGFAHDLIKVPREVLSNWQSSAANHSSDLAAKVIEQVNRTDQLMALLNDLSQQISSIANQAPNAAITTALAGALSCMDAMGNRSLVHGAGQFRNHGGGDNWQLVIAEAE